MTFSKDNQPNSKTRKKRGRGKVSLMLQAVRESVDHNGDEFDYFKAVVKESIGYKYIDDEGRIIIKPPNPILMKEVICRLEQPLKPTMRPIEITLPAKSTEADKAKAVAKAMFKGQISPDVASLCLSIIKETLDIEIGTEIKGDVQKLKEICGIT